MKVVHVSFSDLGGGAARAAWRLHRALLDAGVDSWMLVVDRQSRDERVLAHRPSSRVHRVLRRWVRPRVWDVEDAWFRQRRESLSLNLVPSGILEDAAALGADVIHLHWVGRETVSVAEVAHAPRPLVWTLHDMWAFGGARHYAEPGAVPEAGLDAWTLARKRRHWRNLGVELITPSRWLAGLAGTSELFAGNPASPIPLALDLQRFSPYDRASARNQLGLPADRPLVAFGAVGGLADPRKGGALLVEALRQLPEEVLRRRPVACVFGQARPQVEPAVPVEWAWLGAIADERLMPVVYSSANVLAVPSLVDNFPQTGLEAQACGCPVVTFDAAGMSELIEDRRTGFLAKAGSAASLAEGLAWILSDADRARELGVEARRRAERLWTTASVVAAHREVYQRAMAQR